MVCVLFYRLFKSHTNESAVVPDMKLSPNVGSDRSWVWNAAADVSEGEPEAQTLAIRFANSESRRPIFLNSEHGLERLIVI